MSASSSVITNAARRLAAMPVFSAGDRVRLNPASADNWIDPKLRLRAKRGRKGTVERVIGTALPHCDREYGIRFEAKGREQEMYAIIPVTELEAANDD